MLKQFYEKALPQQGVYCVSGIDQNTKKTTNRFAETLEGVFNEIEKFKKKGVNTFVALASFDGYSRKADNAIYFRSFFIDLDVGETKEYADKAEANIALYKLIGATGLPEPVCIDSGGGMHAYWIMSEDIPKEEWKPYAEKFKALCAEHIAIDPVVTADAARVLRCPDTLNYKFDPPRPTSVINDEIHTYDWKEFKEFLGEIELSPDEVLATISKGLDDETRKMLGMDNFSFKFETIAIKSLNGEGCNQIRYMLENPNDVHRDQWAGGLTIAVRCIDGESAIHEMSNEYTNYNYEETVKTANSFNSPRTCDGFAKEFPAQCNGCQFRGKIKTPIVLGREFQVAAAPSKENTVWEEPHTEEVLGFPDFLKPFVKGATGGIYYMPAPKIGKDKKVIQEDPIQILSHDLFPIRRLHSPLDGECMTMRMILPNDGTKEFLLPMKYVYAQEKLKEVMATNSIIYKPSNLAHLMDYLVRWDQYMINIGRADLMRMQMGWTEVFESPEWGNRSFVIGNQEVTYKGEIFNAPTSPFVRGTAKLLTPVGSFDKWKIAAQKLNTSGLEIHAFTMLCGFGSPLMSYTSTSGVTLCLVGRSGNAKTGAMYGALSVFGNPKELSVFESTDNGMTGRYLGLHNLVLGVDEIGNKDTKVLSQLVHKISHGKAKIRMQASVNAEREHEMAASLIGIFTSNESAYSKFEGFKATPDGEAARLIEFVIKKPAVLDGEGGGLLGREIFDTFRTNYGHAGIPYIQHLFELGDAYILTRMEHWRAKFIHSFGDDNSYRFYENLVLATFTAGDIVNSAGLVQFDLDRIFDDVVARMINIRDNVIRVNKADYESVIGDYMNQYIQNTLVLREGRVITEPRGALHARVDQDKGIHQISKTHFKEHLREKQINVTEFEAEMKDRGVLIEQKRGRLNAGWKGSGASENVWMYYFKVHLPDGLIDDSKPNT
jgi:Domain of unknown function (DUF927)